MKKVIKQVLGIDVAQKELVICLGKMSEGLQVELYARNSFANNEAGFKLMLQWVKKLTEAAVPLSYVMEATGVYHEQLAYFLTGLGLDVFIVMPNKINHYIRSLNVKTVTDKTAAEAIARFGLGRAMDKWQQPSPLLKKIKQLTRERSQIIEERSVAKSQLHAQGAGYEPNKSSLRRVKQRIALLDKQVLEITAEITALVKSEEKVASAVKLLSSITGISTLTAAIVLAETNGFDLIKNRKQLASYAGLDVTEKQSGTSVKGKPRISKKGNIFIRKAMYMPALSAIRCDERWKTIYDRLVSRHGIKMKAIVAVQRKLLELMLTLYKTGKEYDKYYLENDASQSKTAA